MNEQFTNILLLWYDKNRRDLPWRNTNNPYEIWISEIILQQTRVIQGYDYYLRFIERFPTVELLANATLDEVLRMWQGLGYYSRARNLHAAAQQIVKLKSFPNTYNKIKELKGVGSYTAAAIASFAFNEVVAVVDGNVNRVLSRYFGVNEPVDSSKGKRIIHELAQQLIPKDQRSADYNQAIMDFGALQCTPHLPRCIDCPMAKSCHAIMEGTPESYPIKQKKQYIRHRYFNYFHIECESEFLLFRRSSKDIWMGLFEPWLIETPIELEVADVLKLAQLEWVHDKAIKCELLEQGNLHKLSHQTIHSRFFLLKVGRKADVDTLLNKDAYWVSYDKMDDFAKPVLVTGFYDRHIEHIIR